MSREPIQFKTGVVRPIKPLDLKKREIFEEVGRAIIYLSNVENWIANLAYQATFDFTSGMQVPQMFFAVYGFGRRLQFADLMMEMHAADADKARWKEIALKLKEHKGIRNLVAHHMLNNSLFPKADGEHDIFLQPPELSGDPSKKIKTIRIAEIRATASALEKISGDLEDLWWEIDGRDSVRSSYEDQDEE